MDETLSRPGRMPIDLFFVRHGHSEGNEALEADKHGDPSFLTRAFRERQSWKWRLTDTGRDQAAKAGVWLRAWMKAHGVDQFDRYYCSPFVRTMETAALLGLPEAEWHLEPLLRERDWGVLEGLGQDTIADYHAASARYKRRNRFLWRPDGGESTPDIDMRMREMFATFARELYGQRVICVAHEDVMSAVRFRLEKYTIDQWLQYEDVAERKIVNCAILHYTRRKADNRQDYDDRFCRVRLVDPSAEKEARSTTIDRRQFSNEQLLKMVGSTKPLSRS